ncbi:MAG: Panacea domain-containing protein [Chloroflexi bacterium]|nr:Panacea domain-containing protein [Chloroflexota bacterium]
MMVTDDLKRFAFQREEAIELILYLAWRLKEPTVMQICKLMYFADKQHLNFWGQFLCGNDYVAMEHGPVPIDIYELLDETRQAGNDDFEVGERVIRPLRAVDMKKISEAAQQTLDWVLREYGEIPIGKLRDISHEETAWKNAWKPGSSRKRFDMPILSIAAMLPDSESLIAHLQGND